MNFLAISYCSRSNILHVSLHNRRIPSFSIDIKIIYIASVFCDIKLNSSRISTREEVKSLDEASKRKVSSSEIRPLPISIATSSNSVVQPTAGSVAQIRIVDDSSNLLTRIHPGVLFFVTATLYRPASFTRRAMPVETFRRLI